MRRAACSIGMEKSTKVPLARGYFSKIVAARIPSPQPKSRKLRTGCSSGPAITRIITSNWVWASGTPLRTFRRKSSTSEGSFHTELFPSVGGAPAVIRFIPFPLSSFRSFADRNCCSAIDNERSRTVKVTPRLQRRLSAPPCPEDSPGRPSRAAGIACGTDRSQMTRSHLNPRPCRWETRAA